jgi:hypothetical protein
MEQSSGFYLVSNGKHARLPHRRPTRHMSVVQRMRAAYWRWRARGAELDAQWADSELQAEVYRHYAAAYRVKAALADQ